MAGRTKLGMGLTQTGSDEGGSTGRTSQQISNYSKRKRSPIYKKTPRGKIIKIGMLSGGQSKLDKNKNNKIDAEDFALLRKEKSKDKPMKAKRGMSTDEFVKRRKKLMGLRNFARGKGLPIPLASTLPKGTLPKGFGKAFGNFPAINTAPGSIASKAQVKQGTQKLGGKGRVGTALALGAVGVGAIAKKIKERMDKRKAKKRDTAKVKKMGGGLAAATERLRAQGKMGGGMMNKPMGYKSGKSVMAKGCKLGRKKPTKMYT